MLNCLLRIKDRREDLLRRQMTELTQQLQQKEQLDLQCQNRRKDLAQALDQLLLWSGTLPSRELMVQKQAMNDLFHEEYSLAQQQRLFAGAQKRLQEKLSGLQRELVSVMKKKEKLRSLLSDLLRIKERREDRLRRQMTELTQQRQQTEQLDLQCQNRRKDLAQALDQLLLWSGTLPSRELMAQKQAMNDLFHEEYGLAQQQRLLAGAQKRLQEQLSGLQRELVSVMKKKEKLKSLLSDEC